MPAFPLKADIATAVQYVRFVPRADIASLMSWTRERSGQLRNINAEVPSRFRLDSSAEVRVVADDFSIFVEDAQRLLKRVR